MTHAQFLPFFLDSVLVPLGWPLTVLFGMLLFKRPLKELIDRLRKIGKGGAEFAPSPQVSQTALGANYVMGETVVMKVPKVPGSITAFEPSNLEDKADVDATTLISDVKALNNDKALEVWIDAVGDEIATANEDTKKRLFEYMTLAYASARRNSVFEKNARLLFGSQFRAMKQLVTGPCTDVELLKHFEQHKKSSEGTVYNSLSEWLKFLEQTGSVIMEGGLYKITPVGRNFLDFIHASQIADESFIF